MATISLEGAAQVLLPPEPGLPYLRHDRAGAMTLEPGSLTIKDDLIAALDATAEAHLHFDVSGCAVIPGFVDCHTHLPFAGWREDEYARKVAGAGYEEIARAGGGIRRSAAQLAQASDAYVVEQSLRLVGEMGAQGTTAFETKTGYGLSRDGELRQLRLAADIAGRVAQPVAHTALLAHAVPDGHTADSWLDEVEAMLPDVVAAGAEALDCYVESIAFTNAHLERIGALAAGAGLALRAHVEQFATHRSVGPALAAGARTLDHLSCLDPADLAPLAASETACVLLPSAEVLGNERTAPGRALADAGAICALATDLNPGTSPVTSMPLVLGLAVRRYGWTAREALLAATLDAAWAIGMSGRTGSIEVGKRADLLVVEGPVERIPYRLGHSPVVLAFVGGVLVHLAPHAEGEAAPVITADDLAARMAGVEPIGLGPEGTTRLAWTSEDAATAEWFAEQAAGAGLRVRRDPAGNLWAEPDAPGPWWAVGSHLDSVVAGGRYDGALGVAAGFAIAARTGVPVAVISFADEEGSRFNTPTFGSRALVGALDVDDALARVDAGGTSMADAMRAAGVDPAGLASAPEGLSRLRGFLELHIDQGRGVLRTGRPAGVVSALAARRRLAVEVRGAAGHAGAADEDDRRDALAAAARVIVAADDRAPDGVVVTASRLLVRPNALTTVASEVDLWIDARSPDEPMLERFLWSLERSAKGIASGGGVEIAVTLAASSPPTVFDEDLRARLVDAGERRGGRPEEVVCLAGHDAGALQRRIPAGMVLVRNAGGLSHAPGEHVEMEDAAVAAAIILDTLEGLAA